MNPENCLHHYYLTVTEEELALSSNPKTRDDGPWPKNSQLLLGGERLIMVDPLDQYCLHRTPDSHGTIGWYIYRLNGAVFYGINGSVHIPFVPWESVMGDGFKDIKKTRKPLRY